MSAQPTPDGPAVVDVVVVGAGPAGCAAALTLHRSGLRVVVVDKAHFPRDKCCGDGLTTAALRELEALGVTRAMLPGLVDIDRAEVRVPDGRRTTLPLPDDGTLWAASVERKELDAALVDLVLERGIEVVQGCAVRQTALSPDGTSVWLDTDAGPRWARWVVAADGMWSTMRRQAGAGPASYLGDWHAGRQYFADVGPEASSAMWVWFEEDLIPGYVWSFPLAGGRANVGFGVHRRAGERTTTRRSDWEAILARPHIAEILGPDAHPEAPWRAWPIPTRIGNSSLSALGGRMLFVGDAARACDSMTGEGVAQAIETATLAARAIVGADAERPDLAARRYQRSLAGGLRVDDALGRVLTTILARPRAASGWIRLVDSSDFARRHFARWMFEAYPKAGVASPARWAAAVGHGRGAWHRQVDVARR